MTLGFEGLTQSSGLDLEDLSGLVLYGVGCFKVG
jgi:hypothetical protein